MSGMDAEDGATHVYDGELADIAHELPRLDLVDYRASRAAPGRSVDLPPGSGVSVADLAIPTDDGRSVPVRIYRPLGAPAALPVIVHFHGGGYVVGSLETSHARCAALSEAVGAAVVSVGYRLAPEHAFPSAVEDGVAVLRWVHGAGRAQDLDVERVALHGRSAGAGLAARVAIEARNVDLPLRFQYLNCPQLDPAATDGSMLLTDTAFLDAATVRVAWRHYLGADGATDARLLANASPLHQPDLGGLPPTYIAVMQLDPLRDQGIAYATRLLASGVAVELHAYPGTFHCSSAVAPRAAVSVRELEEEFAVLRRALRAPALDARTHPDGAERAAGPPDEKGSE